MMVDKKKTQYHVTCNDFGETLGPYKFDDQGTAEQFKVDLIKRNFHNVEIETVTK